MSLLFPSPFLRLLLSKGAFTEVGTILISEIHSQTKASDFEGVGGPEDKLAAKEAARPGDQDVQSNVRQSYDTKYGAKNKEN